MLELTDIDSVRQFMQKSLSDKLQDEDLEILINQASEAITGYTNREFTPTNGATRSFEYTPVDCYDVLDLAPYELRTLTKVQLDPEVESGTELTGTQYRLRPYPPRDGTYFGLRLSGLPASKATVSTANPVGSPFPFFTRRIDITGNWGMAQIPAEVQHYANLTVESWAHLRRDGGMVIGAEGEAPVLRAEDLPPAARWGLRRRWMRPESLV
jgi:hypothetical protein